VKPLDKNKSFSGEHVSFNEPKSVLEDLSEGLAEDSVEDLTERLAEGLTGSLTGNSSGTLNDDSVKCLAENLAENPVLENNLNTENSPIRNSIGMEFILIPAGEFEMGSPSNEKRRKLWESPVHRVSIKKQFYLARYPITQEQWTKVMGTNPSYFKGEQRPVENVSWEEAQAFIRKLNTLENTGEKSSVYRLPTEAEWEYAARAGNAGSYFFGDEESKLKEYSWFLKNSGLETHPVGLKKPNPWELYDMYGNVGEWVQDEYHISYKGAPSDGKAWENSFPSVSVPVRIRRGGGWNGNAGCCRSAERLFAAQNKRLNSLGFRVVKVV
jgi:formylglycine-generating enzyme required for sulfatase activity